MPADGKIGIGDQMGSGTDGKIDIESVLASVLNPILQIESYHRRLPSVTKYPIANTESKKPDSHSQEQNFK